MMKRIAVIGSGGSGKSTFSILLGEELNLPVHHLDQLYWKPNWIKPSKADWVKIQERICDGEHWIIDGNYQSTLDIRLEACDTVIFLDVNRYFCIYRALKRAFLSSERPDLADGCDEKIDIKFIKFLWEYPKNSKPVIIEKLNTLTSHKRVIIAKSGEQVLRILKAS
ncbi:topology modulation protein [Marinomonas gallaica]|uniref:Topology modulation protein n=2 Tax=Marinomonas gallaica TaxID=1806667 RepID=A0A1C3JN36_9GAMM|nr:DNA topology modulation protein [Marinomonas gallaica]SBT16602.1 topology modulation protein [Marinomonas gallaica]SBT20318.1 topology modulation protein [Marinomonas gallaica]